MVLFVKSYEYITSYQWFVVTSLSCTVSEMLPLLQCTSLSVTLRSPVIYDKIAGHVRFLFRLASMLHFLCQDMGFRKI